MPQPFPQISFRHKKGAEPKHFELKPLSGFLEHLSTIKDHNPNHLHKLDFYIFIVNLGRSFSHKVDFKEHTLTTGEALIISPGQMHAFDLKEGLEGYILIFAEPFWANYVAPKTLEKIRPLFNYFLGIRSRIDLPLHQSLIKDIQEIMENENYTDQEDLIGLTITSFLLSWVKDSIPSKDFFTPNHSIFDRFRQLVEEHFSEHRDAQYYADLMGVTYKKLNSICSSVLKQSPKSIIDQIVILQSKRQLASSLFSIKELGYAMGFDSPTNFTKYFKKHTGITPKQFKTQIGD